MSPNPSLMRHYGTAGVYQQKLAGAASLAERLTGGLLAHEFAAYNQRDDEKAREQGAMMSEMMRELELAKIDQAASLLRYTPVRRFARPNMPSFGPPRGRIDDAQWDRDLDGDTIRLASVAARIGSELAKEAGIGDFATLAKSLGTKAMGAISGAATKAPGAISGGGADLLSKGKSLLSGKMGLGIKGNLLLAGGAAGALWGGNKLLQKGTQAMGSEASGPTNYGSGGHGFNPANAVNEYGQPQH